MCTYCTQYVSASWFNFESPNCVMNIKSQFFWFSIHSFQKKHNAKNKQINKKSRHGCSSCLILKGDRMLRQRHNGVKLFLKLHSQHCFEDRQLHGRTADALRYVLPPIKNSWPFCSEQLRFSKEIDWCSTSNFYLKITENNENDIAAQVFWAVFYSSQRPSQLGPTAYFYGAAIPPPIFSMGSWISE